MIRKPISDSTVEELLLRAVEFEALAAHAATRDAAKQALQHLASRIRTVASMRAADGASEPPTMEQPGEPASQSGLYEQHNVFGTPTGVIAQVEKGNRLPAAPIGFTWCLNGQLPEDRVKFDPAEIRASHEVLEFVRDKPDQSALVMRLRNEGKSWQQTQETLKASGQRIRPDPAGK